LYVHELDFWIQFQHLQYCAIGEAADEAVLNNSTEKYAYLGRLKYREACSGDYFYQCRDEELELFNSAGGGKKVLFLL
jgi:hypothetical protein